MSGPSPGFSSRRGQKTDGGAKNQKGGPHFKNTVLDVCSNRGAKREMGRHRFQMGGPGTTAPPLATTLNHVLHRTKILLLPHELIDDMIFGERQVQKLVFFTGKFAVCFAL